MLLAGALWLAGCGADVADEGRDWPSPSPAIWEVRGPAGQVGWLFGTVHALPADIEWRTPRLDEALAQADLLVVEIAELGDDRAAQEAFASVSRTPGLPPLARRVAEADRPALAALLREARIDEDDLRDVESWAAALILGSAVRDYDAAKGVDRVLLAEADRVLGLESHAAQYARFDALSDTAQARLLTGIAKELQRDEQAARIEAWLTGDLDRLEALSTGGILEMPELREALLVSRNRQWAGRIARLIESGERPFVAVGAGHMLGEEGLPALLEARAFTVRRVQ